MHCSWPDVRRNLIPSSRAAGLQWINAWCLHCLHNMNFLTLSYGDAKIHESKSCLITVILDPVWTRVRQSFQTVHETSQNHQKPMKWRWYSDTFECQPITALSTNFDYFNHTIYQLILYLWLSERSWSFGRLRFDTALGALPAFPGEGSSLLLGWRFRPLNCTRGCIFDVN